MAFTPLEMDGQAAARTMLSWKTYPSYRCLEAVHNAFPFEKSDEPGAYRNAIDEWNRCPADRRHPGDRNPPSGAILLFDLYVQSLGYNAGHIMIAYGGGENAVSTDRPTYGRIGMTTISDIERDWGGRYLGWTNRIGGHTVITAATSPLAANERRAGAGGARGRADSNTQSAKIDDAFLEPGAVAAFDGFVHGESVEGNDIWIRGAKFGRFYWSGSFEGGANVNGLPLLGASPARADQRVVTGEGVYERTGPGTSYARTGDDREFAAGQVLDFKAWTRGESVTLNGVTTDVWYQGAYAGMWFSAACFTRPTTDGLPEVTFNPGTPAPSGSTSTPAPVEVPEWKKRIPDSGLAKWIGSPNFNYRTPRPATERPTHVTMHWMAGTLAGTDSTFQDAQRGSAATYGIGQTEIHQYVREQDYQQADGNTFSNRYGISIEHEAGPGAPATQAVKDLSALLLVDIAKRNGWERYALGSKDMTAEQVTAYAAANPKVGLLFWHSKWVDTTCPGTLPYAEILAAANHKLIPDVDPAADTITVDKSKLRAVYDWLKSLFGGQS